MKNTETVGEERAISCRVEPADPLVCGDLVTCTLAVNLEREILPGGSIRFIFTQSPYYREPPVYGLPAKGFVFFARVHLQTDHPSEMGFLTCEARSGRAVHIELEPNRCFFTVICDEGLQCGDALSVVIGDRCAGGPGVEVAHHPTYAEDGSQGDWQLVCEVDRRGDGDLVRQEDMPILQVVPLPPSQVLVRTPTLALPDVSPALQIVLVDRFGNHVPSFIGSFELVEEGGTSRFSLRSEDAGCKMLKGSVPFAQERVHRVVVQSIDSSSGETLRGTSNPAISAQATDDYQVFWGDLHGHSYWSDGTYSPQFYFHYARALGFLDFCALTDHDTFGDEVWPKLVEAAALADAPGAFTTFLGYEWTGDLEQSIVVLYRDGDGGYYPGRGGAFPDPAGLVELVSRQRDAMIVRHDMPQPGHRWRRLDATGELERLVEIYSPFHASEGASTPLVHGRLDHGNSVQAALAQGLRFGFIGCSDSHASMPGRRQAVSKGYPGYQPRVYGLTAVYARENTRQGIFDALGARRCYAATDRIWVDFRIDGHRMGEEVVLGGPRTVTVRVAGTAPLVRVELLRNNRVIYSAGQGLLETTFGFRDVEESTAGYWYYVRVVQEDGGMAWTSPIWIDPS